MISLSWWLALLIALLLVFAGWCLSGWSQLRRAQRAMDRLQARELRPGVVNPQKAEDQAGSDG